MKLKPTLAAFVLSCLAGPALAAGDQAACVAERTAQMQQQIARPFAVPGRIVCSAADEQQAVRQTNASTLTYHADPGYAIVPGSVTVEVMQVPNAQGSHSAPDVTPAQASVQFACERTGAGSPETSYAIALRGLIAQPLSTDMQSEIEADCRGRS